MVSSLLILIFVVFLVFLHTGNPFVGFIAGIILWAIFGDPFMYIVIAWVVLGMLVLVFSFYFRYQEAIKANKFLTIGIIGFLVLLYKFNFGMLIFIGVVAFFCLVGWITYPRN